jgi:hypothetical protein
MAAQLRQPNEDILDKAGKCADHEAELVDNNAGIYPAGCSRLSCESSSRCRGKTLTHLRWVHRP